MIRVNNSDEVPYYDIPDSKGNVTRYSGLFKDKCELYYSVGARPDTIQENKNTLKIENPTKLIGKQNVVEIIPLGCNDDEIDYIAKMTHELRNLNLSYGFHTILPFPLHQLQTVKKYLRLGNEHQNNWEDDFEEMLVEIDEL